VAAASGPAHDTVQAIVTDLEQAGYLSRPRPGEPYRHTVRFDKLGNTDGRGGLGLRQILQALGSASA
jgi:hypothetical protein